MTRITLAALLLLILLGGLYGGLREVALRSADQLTVTVTRSPFSPDGLAGSIVYQHSFGHTLAAEAERLLNDQTSTPSYVTALFGSSGNAQVTPGQKWHYHLAFSWHGMLVETADMTDDQSPEFNTLSALGLTDLMPRTPRETHGASFSIIERLSTDSGGSIPLSIASPAADSTPSRLTRRLQGWECGC